MFPGQGSQYIGMGKEFYEQIPICKEVYDLASEVTGLDIPALCFEENEKINITEYTQICMLATEAAIYMALEQNGYQPDVTAGLSLGEYGALIASGVMTAEEAFELVRKRGIFMQEAVRPVEQWQQCWDWMQRQLSRSAEIQQSRRGARFP